MWVGTEGALEKLRKGVGGGCLLPPRESGKMLSELDVWASLVGFQYQVEWIKLLIAHNLPLKMNGCRL